jgi:type II secretory pathway pseudopilin PulG
VVLFALAICFNWRELWAGCIAAVAAVRKHKFDVFKVRHVSTAAGAILAIALVALGILHPAALTGLAIMGDTARADQATLVAQEVIDTFKEVYLDALDAIPDATPLTAQLAKTTKVEGAADTLTFNVKLQTGGAVANVGDGQKLPRPSRGKRKKGKTGLAHTYTVIAVGGQSIPLTKKTRNAFVSNLEEQLEDGMERVKFDLERQYNGDGRGILCLLETVGGAPTYAVNRPYGYVYTQDPPGTQLLVEDMDVAVINPGTGLERGRSKINSIDFTADTVTLAGAVAGAAIGDYLVLCNDNAVAPGSTDASINYLNECNGIGSVIGTGVFENIDGALFRRWTSIDVDAAGADPSEKSLATLDARTRARSGQKPGLYYTTRGIVIGYQDTLSAKRMYTGETMELKGGYTGLSLNGRTVLEGDWCPKGHLYALNLDKRNVAMVDVVKMGYVDLDGSKLHRIEGRHSYRADLWFPHNAIWFLRAAQGRMKNINDDLTIMR